MTNDQQKKLLQEIQEPVFNLRRMNLMVDLLTMIVEDNTTEKIAKNKLIETLKQDGIIRKDDYSTTK